MQPGIRKAASKAANLLMGAVAALSDGTSSSFADPLPTKWEDQAIKAWELYLTNNAVKKAIATWRSLVFGSGIHWVADKESRRQLERWARATQVEAVIRDWFVNMLIRGDGVAYKHRGEGLRFERLRSLNPVSIVPVWQYGQLVSARMLDVDANGKVLTDSKGKPLVAADLFYGRNDASEWMAHGNSICLAAMPWCEIQTAYQKADLSIAKRFATVLRLLRIGGMIGNKVFSPTRKDISDATKVINEMDANKVLVTPSYWDLVTKGSEGEALDIVPRVKAVNDQISMAILFYPVFVTGDSGDYATAKTLLKILRLQILEFRSLVLALIDWMLTPDVRRVIGIGEKVDVDAHFGAIDLDVEEWERKLLRLLREDGVLSRRTIQVAFGYDPDEEDELIDAEPVRAGKLWKPADLVNAAKEGIGTKKSAASHLPLPKSSSTPE